jgi:hypothetical protein
MKSNNIIFFLLLLLMPLNASAVPDSLQTAALDAKLAEYFRAMERESLPVQMQECDFIIESAQEPELRQVIAEKVYDHYMESKLMGAEGVAVHVFDKWFAGGKLKMGDEIKQLNARVYADFNRSSLLGCKAPDLRMQTLQGDSLTVFPSGDKRFKVLYFYDVDCAKCKVQTILLRNQLNTSNYPLDFYAIYVGDNKSLWEKYAADHLNVLTPATRTHHLWDAELSSDFQRKYGVLQSPRLFLVNPAGVIAGRGLDAMALTQMLDDALGEKALVYGTEMSDKLFARILDDSDKTPTTAEVVSVADHIAASTLAQADTVLYRQMTGDLMYYLASKTGEGYKEGLNHLIDKYILSQPKIWRTKDDSLKVIGMAQVLDDLLSKGEPGSQMPALKVKGELQTWRKSKSVEMGLDKLGYGRNIVIFYTEGCLNCAAQKKAAQELLALAKDKKLPANERKSIKKIAVFLVNMDEILTENSELAGQLFNAFDMSVLPFLVQSDSSGKITRRYFSLLE